MRVVCLIERESLRHLLAQALVPLIRCCQHSLVRLQEKVYSDEFVLRGCVHDVLPRLLQKSNRLAWQFVTFNNLVCPAFRDLYLRRHFGSQQPSPGAAYVQGGYSRRKSLVTRLLHWLPPTSSKFDPPTKKCCMIFNSIRNLG